MAKLPMRAVCVCALHPLVLQELSRLAAAQSLRPITCKLDAAAIANRARLRIPRASLYVVDSPYRRQDAEYVVSQIRARFKEARILVVAESLDDVSSFAFFRKGARGTLRYAEIGSRLAPALRVLAAGGYWGARTLLSRFVRTALEQGQPRPSAARAGAALSGREREVLNLVLENLSNKDIASRLHISSRTARFHVSNLLAKFGVRRRTDLLLMRA